MVKLKQNIFWVGCGVAVLILVALVALVLLPKQDQFDKILRKLKDNKTTLEKIA